MTAERSNTTAIWWLMAHSHCTGLGQNWETMGFLLYYAISCAHYTRAGTGNIVFYNKIIIIPVPVPVSVPVPFSVPVPCNVYEP